jgi:dTDP-4-dehydrorhamnose 3,5-epimerase
MKALTAFNAAVGTNEYQFVQDNHSHSKAGVLRGLHYQLPPFAQGKLVRVVAGRVWDVAVDIRETSATFGQWFGLELSAANKKLFWIPPGFAHGSLALEDNTEFLYKTNAFYNSESENAIVWNDKRLAIEWPLLDKYILNKKDEAANLFFKIL